MYAFASPLPQNTMLKPCEHDLDFTICFFVCAVVFFSTLYFGGGGRKCIQTKAEVKFVAGLTESRPSAPLWFDLVLMCRPQQCIRKLGLLMCDLGRMNLKSKAPCFPSFFFSEFNKTTATVQVTSYNAQEWEILCLPGQWCAYLFLGLRSAPPAKQIARQSGRQYHKSSRFLSKNAYRRYTFYSTDVNIDIQTAIQTDGICGTDVQTVQF